MKKNIALKKQKRLPQKTGNAYIEVPKSKKA